MHHYRRHTHHHTRGRHTRPVRAFTLIELLVVMVVIGLLVGAITLAGASVMHHQKVQATESLIRSISMAIDQFATANPLRDRYDTIGQHTFGPYPPYSLASASNNYHVSALLDPPEYAITLQQRLSYDLGENINDVDLVFNDPINDDNRALYTYLRVFAPGVLQQVSERSIKPLSDGNVEYVDRSGEFVDRVEVLGFHDAWDVPLDYFLYAKFEYGVKPNGYVGWRATDRVPVLRSRGITRETWDVRLQAIADGESVDELSSEIFSSELPTPLAMQGSVSFKNNGIFGGNSARDNGWSRVPGVLEDFDYLP